ncbi:MAG: phosphate signaling complex protein PhoU [Acutalibacteraceae bacterium]|nr:phosphate signaling complex protein PhoU [Acutalibacteraceae bacterium]
MRDYFQTQLDAISKNLVDMGLLLENGIENSILSLKDKDVKLVEATKQIELDIDRMEKDIENLCLNVILHQQPVASDFHKVSATLKMITDMERIGDISDDIASLSVMIKESRNSEIMKDIIKMGKLAVNMLKSAVKAYVEYDVENALNTCRVDDEIDSLFDKVKECIVEMIKSEADGVDEAPDLLMIAKYFERMGDHCVNIAEWVVYAVTGKRKSNLDSAKEIDEAISDIQ